MDNTLQARLKIYIQRRANGKLLYPLCVKAHYLDIMKYYPNALKSKERKWIAQQHLNFLQGKAQEYLYKPKYFTNFKH